MNILIQGGLMKHEDQREALKNEYDLEFVRELARNDLKTEIEKEKEDFKKRAALRKEILISTAVLMTMYLLYQLFRPFLF